MQSWHRTLLTLIIVAPMLAACGSSDNSNRAETANAADPVTVDEASAGDPLEGLNRRIFAFNEFVDDILLRPIAKGYRYITTPGIRRGVGNVLANLGEPINMSASLLQGDGTQAMTSFWRFVLNSTFGFAGVYDFAGNNTTDLKYRKEDYGQTFAVWGAGSGPYVVLPILGPSNARDVVGKVADYFADPFTYIFPWEAQTGRAVVAGIDARERSLELTDQIEKSSLDPYATYRSGYQQRREAQINNTSSAREPLQGDSPIIQ